MHTVKLYVACLLCVNLVAGNYKYFSIEEDDDNNVIQYFEREDMLLNVGNDKLIKTVNVYDSSDCIRSCENTAKCQSINAVKKNSQYDCMLFSTVDGELQTSTGSFHISKKNMCSGYCKNLGDMKLCGKCDCIDLCNKRMPYMCNCSTKAPTFTDCESVQTAGFNKSGIYNIDPDNKGAFQGFCEFKDDGSAWLTIMRRMEIADGSVFQKSLEDYRTGFGKLYDSFWMGLENMHRVTNAYQNDLRIDIINPSGHKIVQNFENFTVNNQASGYSIQLDDNYQEPTSCDWSSRYYMHNGYDPKYEHINTPEDCLKTCTVYHPENQYLSYCQRHRLCYCTIAYHKPRYHGDWKYCSLEEFLTPRYRFEQWLKNRNFTECDGKMWWQKSTCDDYKVPTNTYQIYWQNYYNNRRLTMLLRK